MGSHGAGTSRGASSLRIQPHPPTRNGRSYVVLMSAEDLETLEATLELLSDPDALGRLAQAQTDLAAGRHVTQTEMAAEMEQRRTQERPSA